MDRERRDAHDLALRFYQPVVAEPRTPYPRIVRDIRAVAYAESGADTYDHLPLLRQSERATAMKPSGAVTPA